MASGLIPSSISLGSMISARSAINSAFVILFAFAFALASHTASATSSMPITLFALRATGSDIVPIPQYTSNTSSSPQSSSASTAQL